MRVLIFGLGFQGKKYVNYFFNKGYIIDGVTKSGENKKRIKGVNNIFLYDGFLFNKNINIYKIIIIAVSPYSEQDGIIRNIINIDYKGKVIIEKPVSYLLEILKLLKKRSNFYFFVDEIILHKFYQKIFNFNSKKIFVKINSSKEDFINILEHLFAGFLLSDKFEYFLDKIFIIHKRDMETKDLSYKIYLNNKFYIVFNKGVIKLNNKTFCNINFSDSLDYILSLRKDSNFLIKNNFLKLRKYLNDL